MTFIKEDETTCLIEKLNAVEKLATASKIRRMLAHPFNYLYAILYRKLVYQKRKKETAVMTPTFFGTNMHILLPSSTDIYLTGGKSHASEIRLARFLIQYLKPSQTFLDIGAHYGYFSLLAARIVSANGRVCAIEAAPKTFSVLEKNQYAATNLKVYNYAASDVQKELTFYEFPNLYSEYNTLDVAQFIHEPWFNKYPPRAVKVKAIVLDVFIRQEQIQPDIIKIDVEGAEFSVLSGLTKYMKSGSPFIIMEYLSAERGNKSHQQAADLLRNAGFTAFKINAAGALEQIEHIEANMEKEGLDSDNIVFKKV